MKNQNFMDALTAQDAALLQMSFGHNGIPFVKEEIFDPSGAHCATRDLLEPELPEPTPQQLEAMYARMEKFRQENGEVAGMYADEDFGNYWIMRFYPERPVSDIQFAIYKTIEQLRFMIQRNASLDQDIRLQFISLRKEYENLLETIADRELVIYEPVESLNEFNHPEKLQSLLEALQHLN